MEYLIGLLLGILVALLGARISLFVAEGIAYLIGLRGAANVKAASWLALGMLVIGIFVWHAPIEPGEGIFAARIAAGLLLLGFWKHVDLWYLESRNTGQEEEARDVVVEERALTPETSEWSGQLSALGARVREQDALLAELKRDVARLEEERKDWGR